MKFLKVSKKSIFVLLIILSVVLSKSLYFETFGDNSLIVFEFFLILFVFLFMSNREIKNSKILFFLILCLWIFLNPSQIFSTSVTLILLMFNSLIISELISIKKYTKYFKKIILILCVASLLRYVFIVIGVSGLPIQFQSLIGLKYSNYILFGIINEPTIFLNIIRNNGLWYEPGAFQIFINLAFLLGLSFDKISKKEYLIFLITILTTLSTAGIIIFIYISIYYFNNNISKTTIVTFGLILIFSILILPINDIIFNKFSLESASTSSRINDLTFNIKSFFNYPILGTGVGESDQFIKLKKIYNYGTGSNTFGNILMYLGVGSIIFYFPFFSNKIIFKRKTLLKFVYPSSLFLIFFTQSFVLVHILWILYFYHLNNINVKILNNHSR